MRPLHSALRRAVLIGLTGGLVGGLAATLCRSALSDACPQPDRVMLEIPDE